MGGYDHRSSPRLRNDDTTLGPHDGLFGTDLRRADYLTEPGVQVQRDELGYEVTQRVRPFGNKGARKSRSACSVTD